MDIPGFPTDSEELFSEGDVFEERQRQYDVGRGRPTKRLKKPIVYFAGRIDGSKRNSDWRNAVEEFDGLYGLGSEIPYAEQVVDCGSFVYGGPFPYDWAGGHTVGHCDDRNDCHREIWDVDSAQIERADLIVAYIDGPHAHGTLVELGYAAAHGKPIALIFPDTITEEDYRELWLVRMVAAKVYWDAPGVAWRKVRRDWISSMTPLEKGKRS